MSGARVYLVGAGPGDAGLITVRGAQLLARADVVVYDYLANERLLEQASPSAKMVYVGKRGFTAHMTQDEVSSLLVREARRLEEGAGGTLVRLKGGDPFVFGRGGEEALALAAAGIPFEVVPGVTSGVAAPAYAGIPVTHRGLASTVTFVTGHEDPEKEESAIDWDALARLARAGGTLCLYMGMRNLPLVVSHLMERGVPGRTPAAVVQWGTTDAQRTVTAGLDGIARRAREEGIGAPAIILVGAVAGLRGQLAWFEGRPLWGRRIVVTRARAQAGRFSGLLRELGAAVIEVPVLDFEEPDDIAPLDGAIAGLGGYDWVVFTSANGVDAFFSRLQRAATRGDAAHGDARALAGARVAAIGPATSARLAAHGIAADAVPGSYRGEAVAAAIGKAQAASGGGLAGARVLIARAQVARDALPDLLRGSGAQVDVVAAYRTVAPDAPAAAALADSLEAGEVDAVTFTSSSAVRNLVALLGGRAQALHRAALFSIGPVTSATLREHGLPVAREAREYTVPGLVDALVEAYGDMEGGES